MENGHAVVGFFFFLSFELVLLSRERVTDVFERFVGARLGIQVFDGFRFACDNGESNFW